MTDYLSNLLVLILFLGLIGWESVHPSRVFAYGKTGARLRHGAVNLTAGLLSAVITYIFFLPAWRLAAQWSGSHGLGLLHVAPVGIVGGICLALLILDLWTYWWHRLNHRIRFLWRFHRAHHSDPWMDVTSAKRFHPGEIVLSSVLRIPVILLTGVELWHVVFYDITMMAVVFFHHSNITVSPGSDRLLRLLIPSPVMHKIHHSRLRSETDSNYSALFSIWDRVFGSFRLVSNCDDIRFGLDGYDNPESQSLAGLMKTPFINQPEPIAPEKATPFV